MTMIARTIRDFPGCNIDELAEKMGNIYGHSEAAEFMTGKDIRYNIIPSRIKELTCVTEDNKRYYFNPKMPYCKDPLIDTMLKYVFGIDAEKDRLNGD